MKLVVHGGGYSGFTGALFAARAGHEVTIYEPNRERAAAITAWHEPVPSIAAWLGPELFCDPIVRQRVQVTAEFDAVTDEAVHLFAVPTERDGEPMFEVLNAAIDRVEAARRVQPLVLSIESTVHPEFARQTRERIAAVRSTPFTLLIAPRRDWFVGRGHTVETCERVIGADSEADRVVAENLYGPISRTIHWTDTATAEIVKQLENAMLYAGVSFLMGFALTYRDKNVREIIRLAGTHWRIPPWYLTLGVGGYCTRLGMAYLNHGSAFSDAQHAMATEAAYRQALADRLLSDPRVQRIVLLGVSDKPNQRIQHLSPTLTLYAALRRALRPVEVLVHDQQFTAAELGIPVDDWLAAPEQVATADAVIVHTAYPLYREWLDLLLEARLVIDGAGLFEIDRALFARRGVAYYRVGDPGWLSVSGAA